MKVHSLLKSLNAIDEEMIAEADRFAVKRREQLKSRQHIFVTEVTAVAAIACTSQPPPSVLAYPVP